VWPPINLPTECPECVRSHLGKPYQSIARDGLNGEERLRMDCDKPLELEMAGRTRMGEKRVR